MLARSSSKESGSLQLSNLNDRGLCTEDLVILGSLHGVLPQHINTPEIDVLIPRWDFLDLVWIHMRR